MTPALDITTAQRKTLLTLLRQFIPGVAVWAYGSRVKWTARPNSDLDLVAFTTPAQRHLVSELKEALGESNLPFLVDLHVWDEVPERFHAIIRNEFVVLQEAEEKRLRGKMAAGWREVRLSDLGRIVTGKTPSTSVPDYFGGDVPFVTPSDMDGHKVISRTERCLTKAGVAAVKGSFIPKGSVMVSCIGSDMGKVTIAAHDCVCNQQINSIVVSEEFSADFIYYNLSIRKAELQSLACSGSAQPILNKGHFSELPILLPSLSEQRAIASVLGALDDKIESNRRMNETLEALARALFQNWFVDATQAGLPKGWRMGKLRDCCERVENGGTPSRNVPDYWQPQEVPWLTSGEVRQKIVAATENFISRAGLENSSAKLWQKETTVVALYGATAGQVTLLGSEMCSNQACCALIPKSGWRFYVYLHTSSSIQALEQQVRGSAQQNLSQQIVADLPTLLPDEQTIAKFDSVVTPFIERWICNLFESRTLAALRDALLPKLLSGELRVPAAAQLTEARA